MAKPPARKPPWWMRATRYRFGLLKERPADVPRISRPKYQWVLDEWARYEKWEKWADGGKKGARPVWPDRVPQWAHKIRAERHKQNPRKPAVHTDPPAKTVPSRWKDPPWNGTWFTVAWACQTGQYTPAEIAARASAARCRTVSFQITQENLPFWPQMRVACAERGIQLVAWDVPSQLTLPVLHDMQPAGYMADIETTDDYRAFVASFVREFPNLPRALIATGGLGGPENAAPWVDADFEMIYQAYVAHGEDPERGENFAYWRGTAKTNMHWPVNASGHHSWPCLEVNAEGSPELAPQLPLVKPWGDSYGVYTVEYFSEETWRALAA